MGPGECRARGVGATWVVVVRLIAGIVKIVRFHVCHLPASPRGRFIMKSHFKSLLALLCGSRHGHPACRFRVQACREGRSGEGRGHRHPSVAAPAIPRTVRAARPNPIIQGQRPSTWSSGCTEFKSGKRDNAIMKGMATPLSDEDMKNVAAFYASKQPGRARRATRSWSRWARRSTAAASPTVRCPPAPAATARAAPASWPSTRACRASTRTTPSCSLKGFATACARTTQ